MAIQYKVVSKTEAGVKGGGKTMYCAAPVHRETLGFDEIARDISDQCSLSLADSKAAITAFAENIKKGIMNGYSLKLDELGIFSVSFKSEMKESPGAVTAKCVKEIRLNFRPEVKVKKEIQHAKLEKYYVRKKKD